MRRHQFFVCHLFLFLLTINQRLQADDRVLPEPRSASTSGILSDQIDDDSGKVDPRHLISQWSAASQFLLPVTPLSRVEEFKKKNQAYFSGHELTLFTEFQQPVTTQALLANYDWQLIKSTKSAITLRGQPKDVLTRHLCRPFELQINSQSMLPESLKFLSDSSQQEKNFASIELTAFKTSKTNETVELKSVSKPVLQRVAKAVFPPKGNQKFPAATMNSIKRISFDTSRSDISNQSEQLEIELLVARWIAESQMIKSIKFGPVTILKPSPHLESSLPEQRDQNQTGAVIADRSAYQSVLQPWLIDVDRQKFMIESFMIETSAENQDTTAPRIITLKAKPNPNRPKPVLNWDEIEIEFSSKTPLPTKIHFSSRGRVMRTFDLSMMKVQYTR